MLVALGPNFDGSDASYARLSRATGMLAYDLKARIRPGNWGVIKALADDEQAVDLAEQLRLEGFQPILINRTVTHDPARKVVPVQTIELREAEMQLAVGDQPMVVPYEALVCIVRGEVQPGRMARLRSITPASSSSTFRAVSLGAVTPAQGTSLEAFAAADLHFATVLWIGRIDARSFDFGAFPQRTGSAAADLDAFVEHIAKLAGVRVDRAVRSSSLASFADRPPTRSSSPPPAMMRGKEIAADERFDPYSRLVGEAERQLAYSRLNARS